MLLREEIRERGTHFVVGTVESIDGSFVASYNLCCWKSMPDIDTTTFLYKLLPCYEAEKDWNHIIKFEHYLSVDYTGEITNTFIPQRSHELFAAMILPLEGCLDR